MATQSYTFTTNTAKQLIAELKNLQGKSNEGMTFTVAVYGGFASQTLTLFASYDGTDADNSLIPLYHPRTQAAVSLTAKDHFNINIQPNATTPVRIYGTTTGASGTGSLKVDIITPNPTGA